MDEKLTYRQRSRLLYRSRRRTSTRVIRPYWAGSSGKARGPRLMGGKSVRVPTRRKSSQRTELNLTPGSCDSPD